MNELLVTQTEEPASLNSDEPNIESAIEISTETETKEQETSIIPTEKSVAEGGIQVEALSQQVQNEGNVEITKEIARIDLCRRLNTENKYGLSDDQLLEFCKDEKDALFVNIDSNSPKVKQLIDEKLRALRDKNKLIHFFISLNKGFSYEHKTMLNYLLKQDNFMAAYNLSAIFSENAAENYSKEIKALKVFLANIFKEMYKSRSKSETKSMEEIVTTIIKKDPMIKSNTVSLSTVHSNTRNLGLIEKKRGGVLKNNEWLNDIDIKKFLSYCNIKGIKVIQYDMTQIESTIFEHPSFQNPSNEPLFFVPMILNKGAAHWVYAIAHVDPIQKKITLNVVDSSMSLFNSSKRGPTLNNGYNILVNVKHTNAQWDGWSCGYRAIQGLLLEYDHLKDTPSDNFLRNFLEIDPKKNLNSLQENVYKAVLEPEKAPTGSIDISTLVPKDHSKTQAATSSDVSLTGSNEQSSVDPQVGNDPEPISGTVVVIPMDYDGCLAIPTKKSGDNQNNAMSVQSVQTEAKSNLKLVSKSVGVAIAVPVVAAAGSVLAGAIAGLVKVGCSASFLGTTASLIVSAATCLLSNPIGWGVLIGIGILAVAAGVAYYRHKSKAEKPAIVTNPSSNGEAPSFAHVFGPSSDTKLVSPDTASSPIGQKQC